MAGLSRDWSLRLLDYQETEVSDGWTIKRLKSQMAGLSRDWSLRWLDYQETGVSDGWTIKRLKSQMAGLSRDWSLRWLDYQETEVSDGWTIKRLKSQMAGLSRDWSQSYIFFQLSTLFFELQHRGKQWTLALQIGCTLSFKVIFLSTNNSVIIDQASTLNFTLL